MLSRGVDTNTAGGNVTARGDFATAEGMIGFPRHPHGPITCQKLDIVQTEQGARYQLIGPRLFDYDNPLTGTNMGYYWMRAIAIV